MIGDLPNVDAKPPEESLFVCRLNPITTDEDLEIIFSRFGKVITLISFVITRQVTLLTLPL